MRNRRSRTQQALRRTLDEWQRFPHRLRDRHSLARDRDRIEADRLVSLAETARDCHDRNARASSGCGHRTGELSVAALSIDATLSDFAATGLNTIGTIYQVKPGQYSNTVTVTGVDQGTNTRVSAGDTNYHYGTASGPQLAASVPPGSFPAA